MVERHGAMEEGVEGWLCLRLNSLSLRERAGVRAPLDVRHESGGRNELRPYKRTQSVVAAQFIAPIPRILRFTKHFRPDCVRPGCTNTGFREFSPCMRD